MRVAKLMNDEAVLERAQTRIAAGYALDRMIDQHQDLFERVLWEKDQRK